MSCEDTFDDNIATVIAIKSEQTISKKPQFATADTAESWRAVEKPSNNNICSTKTKYVCKKAPEQIAKHARALTKICRFYNSKIGCQNGDDCQFFHINVCWYYNNGGCRYGDKCKNTHLSMN